MNSFHKHVSAAVAAAVLALPFAGIATSSIASAQTQAAPPAAPPAGAPAPHGGHAHMRQMLQQLNLSDSQKQQIQSIMTSTRQKNQNADKDTRHANMRAAMDQINGVLTPAQRTQLQSEMQAARAQRAAGQQGAPQPAPSPQN